MVLHLWLAGSDHHQRDVIELREHCQHEHCRCDSGRTFSWLIVGLAVLSLGSYPQCRAASLNAEYKIYSGTVWS